MYNKLNRKELQIIEQTKREGEELQKKEAAEGGGKKSVKVWSFVLIVFIFFLLAFGVKLLLSLAGVGAP